MPRLFTARTGRLPKLRTDLIVRGERVVQIADVAAEELYRQGDLHRRALVETAKARTLLALSLRNDDQLVGVLAIYRKEVRLFTDKQIALLQNFAAQAVIAMENARLITETREALEQQTATAEVLGVINSSPGDLAPVFDAILEKTLALCAASFGDLSTYSGEQFLAVATRGFPPALIDFYRNPFSPDPKSYFGQLVNGQDVLHIADMAAEFSSTAATPLNRAGVERGRALVELGNARTGLFLALRKDDALLGAMRVFRQEVQPFTDKQIALVENFAAQAVIAMENARLITETRQALEQQTATAEVLQVINSSPGDLAPVFDAMLEKAMRLCGAAFGVFAIYDDEHYRVVANHGVPLGLAEFVRQAVPIHSGSMPDRLRRGEDTIQVVDITALGSELRTPGLVAMIELGNARTAVWVALRKDGIAQGFFGVYRQEVRPFTEKQIALLQNFAAQAVVAMENARLLGELRQRTEEVGELNRDLETRVAAQVDELGRVGRLKRFLAPQLAELIVSQGDEQILESHRREIVVVFCDLRGYTAFTETAEPEEVLEFLRQYHGALGPLVSQFEGTLDQFSGDGIMVFFNDPVPCPDPAERAVKMAVAMREEAGKLITTWRRDGCELGFGAGIAQGYATLGQIGFSERSGYTAIGTVCNLAARLCAEAKDGQILISSRVARAVEAVARLEDLGNLELKGLRRPVAAFNVVQSTSSAEARPNLTVVARGPGV